MYSSNGIEENGTLSRLNTRSAAGAHRICALQVCPLTIALKLVLKQRVTENLSIQWGQVIQRSESYRALPYLELHDLFHSLGLF